MVTLMAFVKATAWLLGAMPPPPAEPKLTSLMALPALLSVIA